MSRSYLRNLNNNTQNIQKYQEQLSSFKEVNRPSDDPMATSKIMDFTNSLSQNEEYLTTIEDSIDWTNVQDSALSNATNSLHRIRQLVQSAANGTMSTEDRQSVKADVEGEMHTFFDSLNTSFGGRYVFAGKNTTTKPFGVTENSEITEENPNQYTISYTGSELEGSNNLSREISPGVDVELLTDGKEFMDEDFNTFFNQVFTALDGDDTEALGTDLLETADDLTNNLVDKRTEIGAVFNRLESAKSRNESESLNLQSMLSKEQDVDVAEKIMEYSMEMVSYEASLQMGTRILQTNILNYL